MPNSLTPRVLAWARSPPSALGACSLGLPSGRSWAKAGRLSRFSSGNTVALMLATSTRRRLIPHRQFTTNAQRPATPHGTDCRPREEASASVGASSVPCRLPQLAGKQAIDHAVAAGSLERHVGTKKALTGKPATLGDMLRRLIVGTAGQFQPGQSQLGECPPGEQANRMCRGTPAAGLGGEPVPNRRAVLIQANFIQREAAEHRVLVVRSDQREVQRIAAQAG